MVGVRLGEGKKKNKNRRMRIKIKIQTKKKKITENNFRKLNKRQAIQTILLSAMRRITFVSLVMLCCQTERRNMQNLFKKKIKIKIN